MPHRMLLFFTLRSGSAVPFAEETKALTRELLGRLPQRDGLLLQCRQRLPTRSFGFRNNFPVPRQLMPSRYPRHPSFGAGPLRG